MTLDRHSLGRRQPWQRETLLFVKGLRGDLLPFTCWPRDARAWARRHRIEALLDSIERRVPAASTRGDAMELFKAIAELDEWMRRERAFIRDYPLIPPEHWTRRDLSPAMWRNVSRAWNRARSARASSFGYLG